MKVKFSKTALAFSIALTFSVSAFAQTESKIKLESDDKVKIEGENYDLKIKESDKELKIKQQGLLPGEQAATERHVIMVKEGAPVTTIRHEEMPVVAQKSPIAAKKTYAHKSGKCATKKVAARKPIAKRAIAYKSKAKKSNTIAKAFASPVILHDTVFVTRVDTIFNMNQTQGFAGYNRSTIGLMDDFEKLKIERSRNGKIEMKKEYRNGREEKREFTEDEFKTYMDFKNF